MLEELEKLYGAFEENEKSWIKDNLKYLSESDRYNFLSNLKKTGENKPDISVLSATLTKTTGKKPKTYYWAVCLECNKEYDYTLPMCPHCFNQGLECRAKAVKVSDYPPNPSVIKYNKTYIGNGKESVCYGCEHNELSFCPHFGDPEWTCQRNEFETCECKQCCSFAKKANRDYAKLSDTKKFSYAKQFVTPTSKLG